MLTMQFGDNLLAETNNYQMLLETEEELAGLPGSVRSAAADAASRAGQEGKWLFTLHTPSWTPFLQYSENRTLREEIYRACTCVAITRTNMTTKRSSGDPCPED